MRPLRRAAWGLCALALSLAACGGQLLESPAGPPEVGLAGGGYPGFLALSVGAPWNTVYRGTRRVKLLYVHPGVEYVEEVAGDGAGFFTVDPIVLVTQHPDPTLFLALQDLRQTFSYRYRDFTIRDWDLFQQQYVVAIVDDLRTVAGIPTVQILIERAVDPLTRYLVDFDPNTGMVLGYQEYDLGGNLMADVYYETFEYDADLQGLELVDYLFPVTTHSLASDNLESIFNFEPLVPTYLPLGYTLLDTIEEQIAPDGVRSKVYLTDGVEVTVLSSREPVAGEATASRIASMQVGTWTAMMGEVDAYPALIAGKLGQGELALVLQSALDNVGQ